MSVKAEDLNGCNNPLTVPQYGIRKQLVPGDNLIEFTPDRDGTIGYTCWMGMITSYIRIVPDLNALTASDLSTPPDAGPAGRISAARERRISIRRPGGHGGGGCCGAAPGNSPTAELPWTSSRLRGARTVGQVAEIGWTQTGIRPRSSS